VTRRQLAAVFLVNAIGYLCVATILVDRGYRRQLAARTGVNAYGYRGVARVGKTSGERRLVVVGGSFAFGSGLQYADTIPALMSGPLGRQPQPVHVANLSEPGAGAGTFVRALNDYAYLLPDVILIVDGYDPPSGLPPGGGRRASAVFRDIGYLPALPSGLVSPAAVSTDVDPLFDDSRHEDPGGCAGLFAERCDAMAAAVEWGLARKTAVVVVTPPAVSRRQAAEQRALLTALAGRFGSDDRLHHVNLQVPGALEDGLSGARRITREAAESCARQLVAEVLTILNGR